MFFTPSRYVFRDGPVSFTGLTSSLSHRTYSRYLSRRQGTSSDVTEHSHLKHNSTCMCRFFTPFLSIYIRLNIIVVWGKWFEYTWLSEIRFLNIVFSSMNQSLVKPFINSPINVLETSVWVSRWSCRNTSSELQSNRQNTKTFINSHHKNVHNTLSSFLLRNLTHY